MSTQQEFLRNVITSAKSGNEGAITLLRQICEGAAEKAPKHDLITIGECLYRIGIEAARIEASRN